MIISIDPGQTTGITVADQIESADNFKILRCGELAWSNRFWFYQFLMMHQLAITAIVIEDFRLFKHKASEQVGSRFPSVVVIGIVQGFAWQFGLFDKIVYQQPYEIKQTHPKAGYKVKVLEQHSEILRKASPPNHKHVLESYLHLRFYLKKGENK